MHASTEAGASAPSLCMPVRFASLPGLRHCPPLLALDYLAIDQMPFGLARMSSKTECATLPMGPARGRVRPITRRRRNQRMSHVHNQKYHRFMERARARMSLGAKSRFQRACWPASNPPVPPNAPLGDRQVAQLGRRVAEDHQIPPAHLSPLSLLLPSPYNDDSRSLLIPGACLISLTLHLSNLSALPPPPTGAAPT